MSAILGSAAIGAGASLLGNVLGSSSQSSANKNNLKIAQMNNQYSERMFNKQMQYNIDMWNKENEYNSASNQRKRLEEAGLNPYMMMNGGNSGVAQSSGAVTPPTPQGVNYQAAHYDFSGVGNAINSAIDLQQTEKLRQTQGYQAFQQGRLLSNQADMYKIESLSKLNNLMADTKNKFLLNDYQKIANSWADSTMNADYNNKVAEFNMIQSTRKGQDIANIGAELDNQLKRINLYYLPSQLQNSVVLQSKDILIKSAQNVLTKREARHELEKIIKTQAESQGIKLNNEVIDKSVESLININIKNSTPGVYGSFLHFLDSTRSPSKRYFQYQSHGYR